MTMMEAIFLLNNLIDESDPDVSICSTVDTMGYTVLFRASVRAFLGLVRIIA